jgi:hypothetical protein
MILSLIVQSQQPFPYKIILDDVTIPTLTGLHSYAFAQHNGKWLILGGRKDGLHARQPFNSFPQAQNNTNIYVVDIETHQFWMGSVTGLSTSLQEQLQSTNMVFHQDGDTLYVAGGYAYAPSAVDHITFPYLTSVRVSSLISDIINGDPIPDNFKQITDTLFAVTGGHLNKIGSTWYLVGGHRFDGRYNPMGNPTYTQTYTNQIRKFSLNNSGTQLSFSNLAALTDQIHLRRRDYNLLPQIFPDGSFGLTISSGVFQPGADLPFLYPVDISENGFTPVTDFNQYLSNYHSAFVCLYDSVVNDMHSIFLGGMSQYYYQNGVMVQDTRVPFVKTISRLTRDQNGDFHEFLMDKEMPGFEGSSAEFFIHPSLPVSHSEIINLHRIQKDTIVLGHIFGGILSPLINPFSSNQTSLTSASNKIYRVSLIRDISAKIETIDGTNPFHVNVFPNPAGDELKIAFQLDRLVSVDYYLTNSKGQLIKQGSITGVLQGDNLHTIAIPDAAAGEMILVNVVFENRFFALTKIVTR